MKFSWRKMFKKMAKVGVTAGSAVAVLPTTGVTSTTSLENGLWVGLASALLTATVNFLNEYFLKGKRHN